MISKALAPTRYGGGNVWSTAAIQSWQVMVVVLTYGLYVAMVYQCAIHATDTIFLLG